MSLSKEVDSRRIHGVDGVSAFYGPGIWGAWLLLVLSTLIDRIFVVERENEYEKSHILGIDLNLASSFAYPTIAAVDILAHMNHYFNDNAVSNKDIALIDAPIVVLRKEWYSGPSSSLPVF
jgi:hypothetical protein